MWTIISIYKVNKLRKSLTSEFTCSWFLSESSLPPELQRNVHCGILEKKCRCIFDAALAMRTTVHKKIKNCWCQRGNSFHNFVISAKGVQFYCPSRWVNLKLLYFSIIYNNKYKIVIITI